MPSYQPKPTDTPTQAEIRQWEAEADNFTFKPANPNASPGSIESKTWGIPIDRLPPADAVAYVLAHFREDVQGIRNHDKRHRDYIEIHPMFKWSLISATIAHFLWFRTPEGARWIMRLFGVEEVEPFRDGYHYFWEDPRSQNPWSLDPPIYKPDPYNPAKPRLASGVELRIFRQWEKLLEPPSTPDNRRPVDNMKALMTKHCNPYTESRPALPDDQVFFWTGERLRDWFLEAQPNRDWPTHKTDRIVGWQWVRNLERSPGVPFFEGIEKVALYKGRAYRIKDANGGVIWCGGKEIRIIPLKDLLRAQGQMTEAQVTEAFQCQSCRKTKACVPATGASRQCCHCYAIECEGADRPSLDKCTMDRECKACADVLTSHQELVTIKTRLSRSGRTGPVPR